MKKFSIIIPTHKAIEYLNICLKSLTQINDKHLFEVIVICDGYFSLHEQTLELYSKTLDLKVLKFETNRGIATSINYGAYSAQYETILIMNDDNIAPKYLMSYIRDITYFYPNNFCISFPQIEPRPSIFKRTVCKNLGETFNKFDWEAFDEISEYNWNGCDKHLGTFPFVINKKLFMSVGGFSDEFGSKVGFVSDWDFFVKVSNIVDIKICNNCYFYHFSQISSSEASAKESEINAHHFFNFKWGRYGKINLEQTSYLGYKL